MVQGEGCVGQVAQGLGWAWSGEVGQVTHNWEQGIRWFMVWGGGTGRVTHGPSGWDAGQVTYGWRQGIR